MEPTETPEITHRFAGTFFVSSSGKIIGQQRDDKPGIDNPGQISAFGGAMEGDEEPLSTALRELEEETNLIVNEERLKKLIDYTAYREMTGEWQRIYYYYLNITDEELNKLIIYEGQGWAYINGSNDPKSTENSIEALRKLESILNKG